MRRKGKREALLSDEAVRIREQVERYVRSYVTRELVQSPEDASVDPQLATIIGKIGERLSDSPGGTILDIGSGYGTLLSRLAELPQFRDQQGWIYVAVDENDKLDELARLTRRLGISRRVEPINLTTFYDSWPRLTSPQLVFCRNVLHELTIEQTAQLLQHVAANLGANDEFIIQDLLRFPESERHHACWLADKLAACVQDHGFERVITVVQGSRSGNAWFNLIAKHRTRAVPSFAESKSRITSARQEQWELWSALDRADERTLPDRPQLIAALDLDLQLTSLTRELRNAGALHLTLDNEAARRVRAAEFTARVDAFVRANTLVKEAPAEYVRFRERGEQLNVMEAFLRSQSRLALVHGGAGTGKTTFINHLLKERVYDKAFVIIDAQISRGLWPIVEQLFAQVGLNLASEILSVLGNIGYAIVEPPIRQFLNNFAARLIIVIDNFDEFVNSNGAIIDADVARLVELIASKDQSKLILTSKSEYLPRGILLAGRSGSAILPTIVRMGRYGSDQTVVNILDDHFDRGKAALSDYPTTLLQAIDRHPLIAFLVGQILGRHGPNVLLDAQFISEVRRRLRSELINRLVDDIALPAVEAASKLRIPVPASMLERLASVEAIHRARMVEVLYTIPDRRWNELISSLGLFRIRTVGDLTPAMLSERDTADSAAHGLIANAYYGIYRIDDDPKWIRESYLHRMLSGAIELRNSPDLQATSMFPN